MPRDDIEGKTVFRIESVDWLGFAARVYAVGEPELDDDGVPGNGEPSVFMGLIRDPEHDGTGIANGIMTLESTQGAFALTVNGNRWSLDPGNGDGAWAGATGRGEFTLTMDDNSITTRFSGRIVRPDPVEPAPVE